MTYLAMNLAGRTNGVSKIHGAVSRRLLSGVWPALLEEEVPVTSVTNGVHLSTWVQPDLARLLGAENRQVRPADFAAHAETLDESALWNVRQAARGRLIDTLRERIERHGFQRGVAPSVLRGAFEGLNKDALYIGFARRFAPYKRAALLFQDVDRLAAILSSTERPVRILIAGKAHPHDGRGQDLLRHISELSRTPQLRGKVLLLEDYDIKLARTMLHGVDVWLNTPTRGDEASGTSGMKAAANGALNLSVPDGWWPEGFDGTNGWSLAEDRSYPIQERQDELDAAELYRLLESELAPAFFERDGAGVPTAWIERVKRSLITLPTLFNTDRMVSEYVDSAYRNLGTEHLRLVAEDHAAARSEALGLRRLKRGFTGIELLDSRLGPTEDLELGNEVHVQVDVRLGELAPDDVTAELMVRHGNSAEAIRLVAVPQEDGVTSFVGTHRIDRSGGHSAGLRLRAAGLDLLAAAQEGLILWA
jgi:starch phosphorylase